MMLSVRSHSVGSLLPTAPALCLIALTFFGWGSQAYGQLCGDCSGDGIVNTTDALVAARIAAGLITPTPGQLALCDVDLNGAVEAIDAFILARYALMPSVVLNCPPQGTPYPTGTQPICVKVADINMDGDLDILVGTDPAGVSGGAIYIHYGTTDPLTGDTAIDWSASPAPETVMTPTGSGVSSILVADIDKDGRLDMVSVDFEGDPADPGDPLIPGGPAMRASFTFYPGTQTCPGTTSSFAGTVPQLVYGVDQFVFGGQLVDVDVDGDLDFVTIGSANGITIYQFDSANNGFETTPEVLTPGTDSFGLLCAPVVPFDPIAVAVADVTDNGMPDIVGAYTASAAVVVFQQVIEGNRIGFQEQQAPSMTAEPSDRIRWGVFSSCDETQAVPTLRAYTTTGPVGAGSFPITIHAGDLDQDGDLDLTTVGAFTGAVSILFNEGNGEYGPPVERLFGLGPIALTLNSQLIDLNRDGVLDLIATSEAADTIIFLEGVLSGASGFDFRPVRKFPTSIGSFGSGIPTNPAGVDVADLDENGANDLVVATTRTGEFQIVELSSFGGLSERQYLSFNTGISYETGDAPVDIAGGSILLGDTYTDIVTANGSGSVSLFEGFPRTGSGLLFPPVDIPLPGGAMSDPTAIAVGNLDDVVDADMVVADRGTNALEVYLHNGDTTMGAASGMAPFLAPTSYPLPAGCSPSDVKIADITFDGRNDLLVACKLRNSVVALINSAAAPGNFGIQPMREFDTSPSLLPGRLCDPMNYAGCGPDRLAVGDADGRLGLDVITGNNYSYDVSVLLNDGMGNLALPATPQAVPPTGTPQRITGLCAEDFDLDGNLDFGVASSQPGGANSHIFIFSGDGQGSFSAPGVGTALAAALGLGVSDIACADLDGDSDIDLVVSSATEGTVAVGRNQLNDPMATEFFIFQPSDCPVGADPEAVTIADTSGDGYLDILTANTLSDSVSYVPGRPGGQFLCTLTQNVANGMIDGYVARVTGDAQEDLICVKTGVVVVAYGTGNDGADQEDPSDDVFDFDAFATRDDYTVLSDGDPIFSSQGPMAAAAADFDLDGDTDIAVLYRSVQQGTGQFYTGAGVEIYWNLDDETRGDYTVFVVDENHLVPPIWRPTLPLLDETGAQISSAGGSTTRALISADLLAEDVNRDGLTDLVALVPVTDGSGTRLVVTLTPGITATDPFFATFDPPRWIDWQGYTQRGGSPCAFDSHTLVTDYAPAVNHLTLDPAFVVTPCFPPGDDHRISQFSWNLGAIQASVTVTDAYPMDGNMEIVVTDQTNMQILVFTVDHDVPLGTPGRANYEAAGAPFLPPDGYPPGNITGPDLYPFPATAGPSGSIHRDLNDDGRPDLIASLYDNPGDPTDPQRGFLFLDQPDCGPPPPASSGIYVPVQDPARQYATHVHAGDYNRDGKVDALVASDGADVGSAFYYDEMLTPGAMMQVVPRVDHILGSGVQSDMLEGDFNNDGRLDVLIPTLDRKLTILLGVGSL